MPRAMPVALFLSAVASVLPAGCATPGAPVVYHVPRVEGVTIDGNVADWASGGLAVRTLIPLAGEPRPLADLDASAHLGWDDRGLLVAVRVRDDAWLENPHADMLYQGDGVELYFAPSVGDPNLCQWVVAPGTDANQPQPRVKFFDHRKSEDLKARPADIRIARSRLADGDALGGYVLEALLPWQALAIEPAVGRELALQLWVNDADRSGGEGLYRALWYPGVAVFMDTTRMQPLKLAAAGQGSPPVDVRLSGRRDLRLLRADLRVVARLDRAGQTVRLVDANTRQPIAEATLQAEPTGWAVARVSRPIERTSPTPDRLALRVDGRRVERYHLTPSVETLAEQAWQRGQVVLDPFLFSGRQLPRPRWAEPVVMDRLVGPCAFEVTYYDANYNRVETAERAGRYGAVVDITAPDGRGRREYLTLYRTPAKVDWRRATITAGLQTPEALGVSRKALAARPQSVGAFVKHALAGNRHRDNAGAVLLAALAEADPREADVQRNGPAAVDRRWWHGLKRRIGDAPVLPHAVHLPEDAGQDGRKHPAVLFLHGSGQRGIDPNRLMKGNPVAFLRKHHPEVIAIVPSCPKGQWWSVPELADLLGEVTRTYPIDPDRLYVTGLSMGGFGTWDLLAAMPDTFAAAAPVCGGGDPKDVARYRHVPVWVFHGDSDPAVAVQLSREMVAAIKKAGGQVRYTEYPGVGHGSWVPAYKDPALYEWMLKQKRKR